MENKEEEEEYKRRINTELLRILCYWGGLLMVLGFCLAICACHYSTEPCILTHGDFYTLAIFFAGGGYFLTLPCRHLLDKEAREKLEAERQKEDS